MMYTVYAVFACSHQYKTKFFPLYTPFETKPFPFPTPFETKFLLFSHPFWENFFAFTHPFWDKVFAFTHPKKLFMGTWKIVPPQQQQEEKEEEEERFPLPDLSAAPQIKMMALEWTMRNWIPPKNINYLLQLWLFENHIDNTKWQFCSKFSLGLLTLG